MAYASLKRHCIPYEIVHTGYCQLNQDPILWAMLSALKDLYHQKNLLQKQVDTLQARTEKAEAETAQLKEALCSKFVDLPYCIELQRTDSIAGQKGSVTARRIDP